ncbi:MAG: hypothetical protein LBF86_01725, partial [Helicobacteraceae bacterium]|nr:hypothetical protein [Helicobacteraceae bacterium]
MRNDTICSRFGVKADWLNPAREIKAALSRFVSRVCFSQPTGQIHAIFGANDHKRANAEVAGAGRITRAANAIKILGADRQSIDTRFPPRLGITQKIAKAGFAAKLFARSIALVLAFGVCSEAWAITATVNNNDSRTGLRSRNTGDIVKPLVTGKGARVYAQVRASLTGSTGINDNWGCTSVKIGSLAPVHFNHANSRFTTATRSFSSENLRAPTVAGTYSVTFTFYSGNLSSGACAGPVRGSYTVNNALQVRDNIPVRDLTVAKRSQIELKGDIAAIGNTSLCLPGSDMGGHTVGNYYGDITAPTASCAGAQATSRHRTYEDDNMLYAYVKDDGSLIGSIHLSNTMAKLNLPTGSTLVEAKLYTIGRLPNKARGNINTTYNQPAAEADYPNNTTSCSRRNDGSTYTSCDLNHDQTAAIAVKYSDTIQLRTPGSSAYSPVTVDKIYLSASDGTDHYMMVSDVTDLMNPDQLNGEYYVKGVQSKLHGYYYGTYAGWMLAVIYEHPDEPLRSITVFDGLKHETSNLALSF